MAVEPAKPAPGTESPLSLTVERAWELWAMATDLLDQPLWKIVMAEGAEIMAPAECERARQREKVAQVAMLRVFADQCIAELSGELRARAFTVAAALAKGSFRDGYLAAKKRLEGRGDGPGI